ncbi:small ribonucleoprotein particle U1 subunit 70K isoform X2 [Dermatophagoides farinae]|uniref:small ribonucleoprotein particle U1 subunit 70K isoform X2 n=1 Tax=Dermatophagoides farinae TaxID=6954 RepID=UPI003F644983
MTAFLPPNLLALFAPRDPIPYIPPVTKLNHEKKTHGYFGVGQYLHLFEDPKDTPPAVKIETREERLERKQREKLERAAYIREQGIALWDPSNNQYATNDPYKTLFVARINSDTSESRLRKEFEVYGPIKKVMLIHDKISGKPRGYAFIEFENERDMHSAYKHADGKKIEGRRVLVDVERGRTVKGWLPRRLGGGLGDSRSSMKSSNDYRSGGDDRDEKNSLRDRRNERDRDRPMRRSRSRERDRNRRDRSDRRERSRDRERDRNSGGRNHHRDHNSKSHHRDRERDRDRKRDRHGSSRSPDSRKRNRYNNELLSTNNGSTDKYSDSYKQSP